MTDHANNLHVRGHENDSYAAIQDIPIMVSPLYKMPKPVVLGNHLAIIPENVNNLLLYPFSLEPEVSKEVEQCRELEKKNIEKLEQKYQEYIHDRIQRQKVAARKIAPGFLDTDTKILTPKPLNARANGSVAEPAIEMPSPNSLSRHNRSMSDEIPSARLVLPDQGVKPSTSVSSGLGSKKPNNINYLEFEQGLAPLDPWDTPENDIDALQEIWDARSPVKQDNRRRTLNDMSGTNQMSYQQSANHGPMRSYQHQQQPQHSMPLPHKQPSYPQPPPHYPVNRPTSGKESFLVDMSFEIFGILNYICRWRQQVQPAQYNIVTLL
ncbi:hypothetical protein K450DRAFT_248653 [Umbelopsis ramanniana AG]|uniref:Uncharacterized protein n=1 Tax=Umbelopsis ramanniana AG TaxID=1314678 RepID=A0AAD5HCS3_UMBRA|nr:uncharacterized protein K450DRAFT_248653 [Umbelopsis ramanniana AG]KAI8578204.1 hypothetical protein K450DRAFT_248653 [Umbelopsis ramanniana AG]